MKPPIYSFKQSELLRGMTSYLKEGACWGLAIKWLEKSVELKSLHAASLSMFYGTSALEGLISHDIFSIAVRNRKYSDNQNLSYGTMGMTKGRFTSQIQPTCSPYDHIHTTVSILAQMNSDTQYYGLIIINTKNGRHAISVARQNSFWGIFDPNLGSWIRTISILSFPNFTSWLSDIFKMYGVIDLKMHKMIVHF